MTGFPPTRHSALDALRSGDEAQRRRALDVLAAAYWRPVYAYLRLRWRKPHDEAADLTQDFFERVLDQDLLSSFDPRRARLRTFLRACLDGLAGNHRRAARRASLRFDFDVAREQIERAAAEGASPEALFDREWARSIFAAAFERLEQRCSSEGKEQHFRLLEEYELADMDRPTYADLARRFGIAVTDVTNRLAWARRQLRAAVLELLRESTASESEFRSEARALLGVEPP